MTSPRKPSAGFWITVALVAVLAIYVLGFGPALALYRSGVKSRLTDPLMRAYSPMIWVFHMSPEHVRIAINWYASLWHR